MDVVKRLTVQGMSYAHFHPKYSTFAIHPKLAKI